MSLFSSLQVARNALLANQIGLQVTGNNIANANTPGYIRQQMMLEPAPTQQLGNLTLGLGVKVTGIVQQIDKFLEERLRAASSDMANGEAQERTYLQLESLVGELSETDLSTSLNSFFGSVHDVLNQPESLPVRNLAVLQGRTLAHDIRRLDDRVKLLYQDVNGRLLEAAGEVNRLLEEVADLNVKIVTTEASDTSSSDAVGLRDQRQIALSKLAELMDVRAVEQPSGSVTVFSGGNYIVFDGTYREVTTVNTSESEDDLPSFQLQIADIDAALPTSSGKIAGLLASRDEILRNFIDRLDTFARTLIFEFNKVYSGGQGLKGFGSLKSEFAVENTSVALDQAGLTFTPVHGSFQVLVYNNKTKLTKTTDIFVDLDGIDSDTTLEDLAASLDAIGGISASVTPQRQLEIRGDSGDIEIAFANDSSGTLAALGLNTFFSGSLAANIDVQQDVQRDPGLFAASRGGIAQDAENAEALAAFLSQPHESQNGQTLEDMYDQLTGEVMQGAAVTRAMADGFRVFQKTLEGQKLGISGVNMDEEAVRMIQYQRAFQASARLIQTINELLGDLVKL